MNEFAALMGGGGSRIHHGLGAGHRGVYESQGGPLQVLCRPVKRGLWVLRGLWPVSDHDGLHGLLDFGGEPVGFLVQLSHATTASPLGLPGVQIKKGQIQVPAELDSVLQGLLTPA